MRLYKVTIHKDAGNDEHPRVKWTGTQADARGAKQEMAMCHGLPKLSKQVSADEVDVPTDKAGLIAFLNENAAKE